MDSSLDTMIPALLKKAGDTNQFIAEEAEKALMSACRNCTESRVLTAVQNATNMRSNSMKQKVVVCLNALIERLGTRVNSFKDVDRLLMCLLQYLNEGALEIRTVVKKGLVMLKAGFARSGAESDFERLLSRTVNESNYKKVKGILEKESNSSSFIITSSKKGEPRSTQSAYEETKSVISGADELTSTGASVFNAYKKPSFPNNNMEKHRKD